MMSDQQIRINVQTHQLATAIEVSQRYPGRIVIGVTAKDFPNLADGIALINEMQSNGVLVSAGLGDGAANQWQRALELALATRPFHLNQVFPAAALSRQALLDVSAATIVNGLIRPGRAAGLVSIGTGPASSDHQSENVTAELAVDLLHEVGIESIKLFPLGGLAHLADLEQVARVAADRGMMVEPTGGLSVDTLGRLLEVCMGAGVQRIMPHLYSSVKDPVTGDLDLGLIARAMEIIDQHLGSAR